MDFTGNVALITGGDDIGRAAALGFAAHGAKVVIVDIDEAAGLADGRLVQERGREAFFVRADVSLAGDVRRCVQAAFEAYGAIDVFLGLRHVLPVMLRQGAGHHREQRFHNVDIRRAGNARLCRFQRWRARAEQGGGRRQWRAWARE